MKSRRGKDVAIGVCIFVMAIFSAAIVAQLLPVRSEVVVPAPKFPSAEAHYNALREQAKGGTKHTVTSLPDWSGIWQSGISTMSMRHPVDAPLSPEYRARYDEKQRQERELGEVYYDRLDALRAIGLSALDR